MTRFRPSHLREQNFQNFQKFNQNFQNCINPHCSCSMDIESTSHLFLHCPLFDDKRITLLSTASKTDCKLTEVGNSLLDLEKNSLILNAFIDYILSTERFKESLL